MNMNVKGMIEALKRADAKWAREILRFADSEKLDKAEFGDRLASRELIASIAKKKGEGEE